MKKLLVAVLVLCGLGISARAEDIQTELTFHTVAGYSLYGNEVLAGELGTVVTFRNIVSLQAGFFFGPVKRYPSLGLGISLKEAMKGLGGSYQWTVPGLEPEIGFALAANTDALFLKTGERLLDVVVHANVFTVKF